MWAAASAAAASGGAGGLAIGLERAQWLLASGPALVVASAITVWVTPPTDGDALDRNSHVRLASGVALVLGSAASVLAAVLGSYPQIDSTASRRSVRVA